MIETPRTTRRWTFVLILATAFGGGLFATFATARSQADPYHGVYRQASIGVVAGESGTISSVAHAHGELVRPGDPLATLRVAVSQESLAAMQRECDELKKLLAAARNRAAMEITLQNERIEDERLETRLRFADLLRARLSVQTRQEALHGEQGERSGIGARELGIGRRGEPNIVKAAGNAATAGLADVGRMSLRLEAAEAVNHEEVLRTQIQLCEDRLSKLDLLQKNLPEKIEGSCGVSRLQAELARSEAKCQAALADESVVKIVSPAHGRVGVWRGEVGDYASPGQTLVEIFDAERPFVLLRVPVSELLKLTVGREVRVEFAGIQTRKPLEGIVREVRSEAERNADAASAPGATQAVVEIAPAGRLWPAGPPGTTVRVYVE